MTTLADRRPPPATEQKLRVSQVAHLFPPGRRGMPRLPATIARYIRDGIDVGGPDPLRLEGGADTAGSWWTTAEAVERFLARLTEAKLGGVVRLPTPDAGKAAAEFQRMRDAARPGRTRS